MNSVQAFRESMTSTSARRVSRWQHVLWTGFVTSLLIAILAFTSACTTGHPGNTGVQQITGTVSYRERMLLPPGSVVEVSLLDVSRADAIAPTLAHQVIKNPPAPPIPFVLEYDNANIDPRMSYAVRAEIRHEGRLLFTTDTHYPVITRGAGNSVDLMLKRVTGPKSKPDASLTNTYWKLVSFAEEPYQHKGTEREPHLKLIAKDNSIRGFTGCNAFFGHFERKGSMLRFDEKMAVTLRACQHNMQIERRYLRALGEVNRYVIQGDTLRLFHDDQFLLGFEAVYF